MAFYKTKQLGMDAEAAACRFLEKKGLRLLKKNYRSPLGEIDLIMQDQDDIVFVEVRFRSKATHGTAGETIDWRKQRKLLSTAHWYLQYARATQAFSRFDVVTIQENQIEWIKNAFEDHSYE